MSEENVIAVEGEVERDDTDELEEVYEKLSMAIGEVIASHANGKSVSVFMPVLDSLSRNVVATLMMLPENIRDETLLTFAQRTKSFYLEAKRVEKEPMGTAPRIITLN